MQDPAPASQPPTLQELRDQIQAQVRDQVDAARQAAQEAAADRTAAGEPPAGPTPIITVAPRPEIPEIPPQVVELATIFFVSVVLLVVGIPIARAIGRWIDRRGERPSRLPPEVTAQLAQISQSVEAVAIEVERISEGQRFTTKLLSDLQSRRGTLLAAESPDKGGAGRE